GIDDQQAITNITIPYGSSGMKRMRIIKQRTSSDNPVWPEDPCGTYQYGQTEDYILDITHNDPPPCAEYRYGELDNVVGDLQSKQIANDFEISSEGTGNVYVTQLETNILRNISTANIYFYTDNAGMPGNLFETIEGIAPESQTYIGTLYGMNFYKMVWEFPEPIFVGVEGEKIWFGMTATPESNNEPNYLEAFDN